MRVSYMLMQEPRDATGSIVDWVDYLTYLRRLGLEGVDLFSRQLEGAGCSVAEAKRVLDDLGLSPAVYCIGTDLVSPDLDVRRASLNAVQRGIDSCGELGISHLFSHGGQHTNSGAEALARYADGLAQAAELAAAAGVTLSIENAGRMCHTLEELIWVVDAVGAENMRITLDPGNLVLAGCDPHVATEQLAPRVVHVHVKNFIAAPGNRPRPFRYCPAGDGIVDYTVVVDVLRSVGYDSYLSFEPEGGADAPVEAGLELLVELVGS